MKKKILLIAFLLVAYQISAQDILWEKSYGGKHADYLLDAVPTPDYGFLLAGSSISKKTGNKTEEGNGDLDYWIWKMDEKGQLEWQKSFGGPGADLLQSVKLTSDAGFILAGTSESGIGEMKKDPHRGKADLWIIKLDAKGSEQWQRTIGGNGQEQLESIVQTSDGGYILGGSSSSGKGSNAKNGAEDKFGKKEKGYGNLDYWVVKLDGKGTIEWQRTLGGDYLDVLRSIEQVRDGGYILGGYSNSPISGNKTEKCHGQGDFWIVKLTQKGDVEWQKTFGGDGDDQLHAIQQTLDGNFIAAGNSSSGSTGNKDVGNADGTDFWLVKFADLGEVLWQKNYNIGKMDMLTSMIENKDGTLMLAGYAQSEILGKAKKKEKEGINDFVAIKIAEDGRELWSQSAGSGGEDILRKIIGTRDGGYLLAGTSSGKVSKDRYTGIGRQDFWVVKLGDKEKEKEEKNKIEAFPNPTQQFTNVIVGYEYGKGTCYVFDLAGRQMQNFKITGRTIPVDLGGLPEGVYIVEIMTDVQNDGVKIIKTISKN